MAKKCDCLNDCGDDHRIKTGEVERCPEGKRSSERQKLSCAVNKFAGYMKDRLESKRKQGWKGWGDYNEDALFKRMGDNMFQAARGNKKALVDVANLAMMIHRQGA